MEKNLSNIVPDLKNKRAIIQYAGYQKENHLIKFEWGWGRGGGKGRQKGWLKKTWKRGRLI